MSSSVTPYSFTLPYYFFLIAPTTDTTRAFVDLPSLEKKVNSLIAFIGYVHFPIQKSL